MPARFGDLEVALPAHALIVATLPDDEVGDVRASECRAPYFERHRPNRIAVRRVPVRIGHEQFLAGTVFQDSAVERASKAAKHLVSKVR